MSKKSLRQSLLNKVFKSNQQGAGKVDLTSSKPTPRGTEQINQSYQEICIQIGDKTVKKIGLEQEISGLMKMVESLGAELSQRQRLDAEAAAKTASETEATPTPAQPAQTTETAPGNSVPA